MAIVDLPVADRLRLAGETAITWAVFDPAWYLSTYPEAERQLADHSPAAVLAWYLEHGQQLGHSSTIFFDETWHRRTYPDVAQAIRAGEVASAFDAYCRGGFRSRSPHWLFDEKFYRQRYPDISDDALEHAELANGYDHYLRHGNFEQRSGHLLFDAALYCADLEADGAERARTQGAYLHYLQRIRMRVPEPRTTAYFDPSWYLTRYKEVAEAVATGSWQCALHHYLCNDTPTAFDPLPEFSEPFYLTHNHDLAAAIGRGELRNGYMHFLLHGAKELRSPSPVIDLHYYVGQEPVRADLEHGLAPNAFWHWLRVGRGQGLRALPPPEENVSEGHARTLWRRRAQALLPLLARNPLDFACRGTPEISVVMVLKDDFAQTLQTLAALRGGFSGDLELVLVDAGSTDEIRHIGRYVRGAQLLPLETEVSLVAGRNAGLYAISADYVLLLQTDVDLAPGALGAALRRMQADPSVGAIGARLIKPHDVLAEAGGIVWRDGSTVSYLRDADPLHPEATFRRSVDFCSSQCLLLRSAPLQEIEGYNAAFGPGAYADADLCRRLAVAGYRTEYDPALTAHSYALAHAAPAALQREREAFCAAHASWLDTRPVATPHAQLVARSNDAGQRVLFVEDTVPLRSIGSGFVRSNDVVRAMATLGCRVTVFPVNSRRVEPASIYADLPDTVEVMHDRSLESLGDFLRKRQDYYDVIWVARAHNLDHVQPHLAPMLREASRPPRVILDSEAIAASRKAERAALTGDPESDLQQAIRDEFANANACQRVVAVNEAEAAMLRWVGFERVSVIGHMGRPKPTPRPLERRAGLLFIGAIHATESPNYDSLCWFVDQVLPLVERQLRWETRLTVAGHLAPGVSLDRFRAHPRVTLRGPVADLEPLYDSHRLFVAPTRFAAGMPYKVHEAACFGLPVVATTRLAGQLGWADGQELLAADASDPEQFAARVVALYRDQVLWQRLRDAALARIAQDHRPEDFTAAVAQVLREGRAADPPRAVVHRMRS